MALAAPDGPVGRSDRHHHARMGCAHASRREPPTRPGGRPAGGRARGGRTMTSEEELRARRARAALSPLLVDGWRVIWVDGRYRLLRLTTSRPDGQGAERGES